MFCRLHDTNISCTTLRRVGCSPLPLPGFHAKEYTWGRERIVSARQVFEKDLKSELDLYSSTHQHAKVGDDNDDKILCDPAIHGHYLHYKGLQSLFPVRHNCAKGMT